MSQFNHKRLRADPDSESILDFDNVELFNRDTLYSPNQRSWLGFIHEQRIEFQRIRKILTVTFVSLIAFFSSVSLLFLIAAIVRYDQNIQNDSIKTLDDNAYSAQIKMIEQCLSIRPEDRIDCNPDPPISKEICEKRRCCWNPIKEKYSNYSLQNTKALPPVDIPFCYFDPVNYVGYKIIENRSEETHNFIHLQRVNPSGFPRDIKNIKLDIYQLTDQIIRIKFTDLENPRFEVPVPKLNVPVTSVTNSKLYSIELHDTYLVIRRRENGQPIFH
ncbi:hypothetical protein BLA29_007997, partial [Euroglyphus maynei]